MDKKAIQNSFFYLFSEILLRGVNLILTPLYFNNLSIDEFGILGLLMATYGILQKILNFGFQSAFTRFSRIKEDNELLGTVWIHLLLSIIILTVIALIFNNNYNENVSIYNLIFIVITIALRSSVIHNLIALMKSRGKAINAGFVGLSSGFTTLLVVALMFYLVEEKNISSVIIANMFGAMVSSIIAVLLCSGTMLRLPLIKVFRELWSYSRRLTIHGFNQWAIISGDRFLIKEVIGISVLGEYFLLYQFPLVGHMFFRAINSSLMPSYSKAALKLNSIILARNHRIILYSVNLLYVLVCVGSLLIKNVNTTRFLIFQDNYSYIPILFSTSCFFALYYIPMNYYTLILGNTKYISLISATAVINGILINLFFLDSIGLRAAILAVWSSTVLLAFLTMLPVLSQTAFNFRKTATYYFGSIINISFINSLFYFGII